MNNDKIIAKGLKLFNGRSHGSKYKDHTVYVAAKSIKQAAELVGIACYGEEHKDLVSVHEINNYYNKNAWGNKMEGIDALEPCVYLCKGGNSQNKPFRVI